MGILPWEFGNFSMGILAWEFYHGNFTMGVPFCWNIFCWKIGKYLGKRINWNRIGITKFGIYGTYPIAVPLHAEIVWNILWENRGDIYWNIYIGI